MSQQEKRSEPDNCEKMKEELRKLRATNSLEFLRVLETPWFNQGHQYDKLLNSLLYSYLIKMEPRNGWVRKGACDDPLKGRPCETVASHQWGVAYLVMQLARHETFPHKDFDTNKACDMALVHDLPEAITTDITPVDGIIETDKHRLEQIAMEHLTRGLCDQIRANTMAIYSAYEARVCNESKFVKDCDRLDFILTAFLYEALGCHGRFEEFYVNSMSKPFSVNLVKELGEVIISTASKRFPRKSEVNEESTQI